jgi:hypothetical protein
VKNRPVTARSERRALEVHGPGWKRTIPFSTQSRSGAKAREKFHWPGHSRNVLECGDMSLLFLHGRVVRDPGSSGCAPTHQSCSQSGVVPPQSMGRQAPDASYGPGVVAAFSAGPKARQHSSLGQRPRLRPNNQHQGLKACVIQIEPFVADVGTGFQPCCALCRLFLGRWPRLVWIRALGAPAASRWNLWVMQTCSPANPKGIASLSPGLRRAAP